MKKRIISIAMTLAVITALIPALAPPAAAEQSRNHSVIAAGSAHTLIIRADGSLWGWGGNENGQLGDGTTADRLSPVRIGTDADWVHVATSKILIDGKSDNIGHTLAIKSDGTLWAWGWNGAGQLGDGTQVAKYSPVRIGTENNWVSVKAGAEHTVALKADGSLWAWGSNRNGQVGDGTTNSRHSPVRIGTDNNWVSVSAGGYHTVAIKADRTLWAWGNNAFGPIGDGTTIYRHSPVRVGADSNWAGVSGGSGHTAAVKADGSLWGWGYGLSGDGTTENRQSPARAGAESSWASVSAGGFHTAAIRTDGSLWGWGSNWTGQLGDGTAERRQSPVRIGTDVNWARVSTGETHTMSIKSDGSLWAWGDNRFGRLGDGTTENRTSPVMVLGPGSISASSPATSEPPSVVPDTPSSWAQSNVTAAISAGLVPASLRSAYRQTITRAEFCALVVSLYEKYNGEITQRSTFSDTNDVNVQKAAAIGVVGGVGNNRFSPHSQLTREQAATMLARLASVAGSPLPQDNPTFSDNRNIASWATAAVGQVQAAGIMGGVGNNTFSPKGSYSREQSITTILRLNNIIEASIYNPVLPPPPQPEPPPATPVISASEFERRVFDLVNAERAKHGIHALIWDDSLANASRLHSEDLARNNLTGHRGSDGSLPYDRALRAGANMDDFVGENVSHSKTPEAVVESWMNSEPHRFNILRELYTHAGAGFMQLDGSEYVYYSTMKFGREQHYFVSVVKIGSAMTSGTASEAVTSMARQGEIVNLSAGQMAGHVFLSWQVLSGGITISNPNSPNISFVMPAERVDLIAFFTRA